MLIVFIEGRDVSAVSYTQSESVQPGVAAELLGRLRSGSTVSVPVGDQGFTWTIYRESQRRQHRLEMLS